MKNKRRIFLCFLILTVGASLFSQNANTSGILYGKDWACLVTAPEGWIMDSESLSHQGVYGLFYEEGKIFGTEYDTPIIYIVTIPLQSATDEALNDFIQADLNGYVSRGAVVTELSKEYEMTDSLYKTYNVDLNGRYETFVFTRYKTSCFLIISNSGSRDQRDELLSKLEEVVNSVKFMDVGHE